MVAICVYAKPFANIGFQRSGPRVRPVAVVAAAAAVVVVVEQQRRDICRWPACRSRQHATRRNGRLIRFRKMAAAATTIGRRRQSIRRAISDCDRGQSACEKNCASESERARRDLGSRFRCELVWALQLVFAVAGRLGTASDHCDWPACRPLPSILFECFIFIKIRLARRCMRRLGARAASERASGFQIGGSERIVSHHHHAGTRKSSALGRQELVSRAALLGNHIPVRSAVGH
jgi:hypothetical protein